MATKTKPTTATTNGIPGATAEVLTLAEAAAFLRVSDEGLEQDAAAGRVPGRLVAGQWRFSKTVLLAWLGQPESAKSSKERMLSAFGAWKDFGEDPEQVLAELASTRKLVRNRKAAASRRG